MRTVHTVAELREALAGRPGACFVPTMGNLHEGHLALVRQARARAAASGAPVVASIFVNRLQFGAGEDFDRYPRTFERDSAMLREQGCDLLFAPDETVMYPRPQTFRVDPDPELAAILEGAARPGHFNGVCTVVLKLFSMVQPAVAVFGKKDYQQLMMIRQMVDQFELPLEIVGHETVREPDGLAMSSRNGYLSAAERAEAPALNRVLRELVEATRRIRGAGDPAAIAAAEDAALSTLAARGWKPGYVTVRRRRDLLPPTGAELRSGEPLVALGAAQLGSPRLLDNVEI